MATYYARKTGSVNAVDVWATTPTGTASDLFSSFTSGDILVANSFTVTINVSLNLGSTGEVRNDTVGGATSGGTFTLNNGCTLTANVVGISATCVSTASSSTTAIIGSCRGVTHNGAVLNITGTITTTTGFPGVTVSGGGVCNITGDISPTTLGTHGVFVNFGSVVIVGNVSGNAGVNGVLLQQNGSSITVTGSVIAGNAGNGIFISTAANCNITGSVSGNNGTGAGVNSTSAVTISGTATGGSGTIAGVTITGSGSVSVTRAKGGPLAGSGPGISVASTATATVSEIEYGDLGASPTSGPIRITDLSSNVMLVYRPNLSKKTLVDMASTSLLPSASNVRNGVVYNANQTTGTMNVPPASSVAVGVPVDNTVGTAAVTSTLIQSAFEAALAAFANGRLANVATISSVSQQIQDTSRW